MSILFLQRFCFSSHSVPVFLPALPVPSNKFFSTGVAALFPFCFPGTYAHPARRITTSRATELSLFQQAVQPDARGSGGSAAAATAQHSPRALVGFPSARCVCNIGKNQTWKKDMNQVGVRRKKWVSTAASGRWAQLAGRRGKGFLVPHMIERVNAVRRGGGQAVGERLLERGACVVGVIEGRLCWKVAAVVHVGSAASFMVLLRCSEASGW